jgi:UDP-N-acetylmuramoylalanine-D-glutamate ligase
MKATQTNKLIYLLNDNILKPNNISLAENIPHLLDDQLKTVKKPSSSYLKYFTNNYKRLNLIREINNVKFVDDSYATNNYALFYSLEKINKIGRASCRERV